MAKKGLEKIYEPDEDKVHYTPYPGQDSVTLCNHTDWIGEGQGIETKKAVTCWECISIAQYIHNHRKPPGDTKNE